MECHLRPYPPATIGLTAFDQGFTRKIAVAVRQGIAEAARHRVSHAGGLHLAVGILATQPNNLAVLLDGR